MREQTTATARRVGRAAARRLRRRARRVRDKTPLWRLKPPTVSIVVPFYNVEDYLGECLDSLAAQTYGNYEVLLVDDGSPDGSRAIAERHAAADPRIRLLTRENGGLGAARNTGIRRARGRFLTFVDSDDLLPENALEILVGSARRTGSDIVAGGVRRFDPHRYWRPAWMREVHLHRREGVTIEEYPQLLRNLYTWNKLFRRDFWNAQQLWFREGVAYEDQPIITQLFARAHGIDVLPDVVYSYRMRDDSSSISQQTASLRDLRDRISAWQATREALSQEKVPLLYQAWLQTLFSAHFHWYLNSAGTSHDTYWTEIHKAVTELTDAAPQEVWDRTEPDKRVLLQLTRLDRRYDAQEFVRREARRTGAWKSTVTPDGILLHLPFFGDHELPDELFLIRPEQISLAHSVERFRWLEDGSAPRCEISGWAYLAKVDLAEHASDVTLLLRSSVSGEIHEVSTAPVERTCFPMPADDDWCDYQQGTFTACVDLDHIVSGGKPDEAWDILLRVDAAGFSVTSPVTRLVRSGSAGVIPARELSDTRALVAEWRFNEPLRMVLIETPFRLGVVRLEGRRLAGTITGDGAHEVRQVQVSHRGRRAVGRAEPTADGAAFRVLLPQVRQLAPDGQTRWDVFAVTADGTLHRIFLTDEPETVAARDGRVIALQRTPRGFLALHESLVRAVATDLAVTDDGAISITGTVWGPHAVAVRPVAKGKKTRGVGERVRVEGDRFRTVLPLCHDALRFGSRPLPYGEHDVRLLVEDSEERVVDVPLRMAPELSDRLPILVETKLEQGRLVRGREGGVRVSLDRPVGEQRGRHQQLRLRAETVTHGRLTRGVLFRSYFGELATDNGLSIQRELRRRGSDLPVFWAVQDHSVAVPEGGISVVVNSPEWYDLLFSVSYYVDNMYQPEYHRKPPGQVIVQTFHGYPFKTMGHPHWENMQFSRARIESYDARSREWDFLVSPARYATALLTRDFAYEGAVLEIGYPRNDVLLSKDAEAIRAVTRDSLGIQDEQTAVLYAPTFRDYLAKRDNRARMADFFDFEAATDALGDGYVLLVRGHAFNARARQRVGGVGRVVDVTDYPEVSDLYLASDAAVVDYSSLRFDYAVTGKPMVFHVPDLRRYQDTRGWLLDFAPTAPGPRVDTTAEVVHHLQDLERLRSDYAATYAAFRENYLDLEDGRAGERFVDAVFVPRNDA